ncbi:MAG: pyridoxine 5'-phosphate synthase [Melioribacteraceae bacterium]|nr:MAG: pyridoxine 5'-phosphate synthase [Melioribacteraceae bacterium]
MSNVKKMKIKYVTDKKGKKTEVILKVKDFEELLEDLQDITIVAERRDEQTIAHKDVIKELKQNGVI